MKQYDMIVWDWNGTIVNDVQIALDAVNAMLSEKGRAPIDMIQYRRAMDTPILKFYEVFFDMGETSFSWIVEFFNEYYASHEGELFLHKGVPELLSHFQREGSGQIVLSSSSADVIQKYAEVFDVRRYFEAVLGAGNLRSESKVQRGLEYFREHGRNVSAALLVGDTVHDFEVARELGTDCVLLACGHQDRRSLEECGCPVYESVAEFMGEFL